ncbi:type II toxin-antitoxin system HicB family antitoxin [Ornithobacterium rhinotracheale]|uniref:type II toxin-antitoxin system HicB family antitoxin n=1 Tax=Ornithobacterium rhinotracheale TaxID=28251 RepID=UPI00129CE97B|nr:type II toxin-antitoxin system HicB family antitoxin [Ornithobacterium rhinotracheale]MRI64558.1 type II toxin-antitoxin system HicB family antitoxin [Ornithobacterium rhinotracheale]MRJ07276.1 type II toxin-antitoxin system HicB family antitoxin [Ornithobacterium rhinotracheale]UOH77878.1 type II toxin-antitoxin system HicB family antitoxin [Ornithobacterium rhinotracheale]
MKTIKIIIEKAKDGSYGAYAENVKGIYGAGDTPQECKQSIVEAIDTIKSYFEEEQIPKELKGNYELVFKFDIESLLQYYKGVLSNPAFEKLTGINQKLIHQYSTGLKKPRKPQRERIQNGLHQLGKELLAIEL